MGRQVVEAGITVDVSLEQAWRAWTQQDALASWFKPSGGARCRVIDLDPRVGGRWRIEVQLEEGGSYRVAGTYIELTPPHRLMFTWRWEAGGPEGFDDETTVDVRLEHHHGRTRIRVMHSRIPSDLVAIHLEGWSAALALLLGTQRSEGER